MVPAAAKRSEPEGAQRRGCRARLVEGAPDPELVERPQRRRFTAEYKLPPPALPTAAWINKPETKEVAH